MDGEGKRLPEGGRSYYRVQADESDFSELWLSENLGNGSRSRVERVSTSRKSTKVICMRPALFISNLRCLTSIILSYRAPSSLPTKDSKCLILRKLPPRKAGTSFHHSAPEINTSGKSVP